MPRALSHLFALTGLRVSEALALRWVGVDLLEAELHVRGSWSRDGQITAPKTEAGVRTVPLSPGLVDLLLAVKAEDAGDEDFVFASKVDRRRPISYWNFRRRGFERALEKAGLAGRGITIHDLRSAAASIFIRQGLTSVEVAEVTRPRRRQHHAQGVRAALRQARRCLPCARRSERPRALAALG